MDFEYHGTYDFCTIGSAAVYAIYLLVKYRSFKVFSNSLISGLYYVLFLLDACLIIYASKYVASLLKRILLFAVSIIILVALAFFLMICCGTVNSVPKLVCFSFIVVAAAKIILLILAYLFKDNKIIQIIDKIISIALMNALFYCILKGFYPKVNPLCMIPVFIVVSMMYFYLEELSESHNNDETIIEEVTGVKREEKGLFNFIGDGDLLFIPFVGMCVGIENMGVFFIVSSVLPMIIYLLTFKKGKQVVFPMCSYMAITILILKFSFILI